IRPGYNQEMARRAPIASRLFVTSDPWPLTPRLFGRAAWRVLFVWAIWPAIWPAAACAQFNPAAADPKGVSYGQERAQKYRVGVVIDAVGGACKGLFFPVPVPWGWRG